MSDMTKAIVVFVTLAAIAGWSSKWTVITEAIERGYIIRCPTTGDLAWKGECDD